MEKEVIILKDYYGSTFIPTSVETFNFLFLDLSFRQLINLIFRVTKAKQPVSNRTLDNAKNGISKKSLNKIEEAILNVMPHELKSNLDDNDDYIWTSWSPFLDAIKKIENSSNSLTNIGEFIEKRLNIHTSILKNNAKEITAIDYEKEAIINTKLNQNEIKKALSFMSFFIKEGKKTSEKSEEICFIKYKMDFFLELINSITKNVFKEELILSKIINSEGLLFFEKFIFFLRKKEKMSISNVIRKIPVSEKKKEKSTTLDEIKKAAYYAWINGRMKPSLNKLYLFLEGFEKTNFYFIIALICLRFDSHQSETDINISELIKELIPRYSE